MATAAPTPSVVNGSFELDTWAPDVRTDFTTVMEWDLTTGFGGGGYNNTYAKLMVAPTDGDQWLEIDANFDSGPGFEFQGKIIDLVTDEKYRLTFDYYSDGSSVEVKVADTVAGLPATVDSLWHTMTLDFNAPESSLPVVLSGGASPHLYLDNFKVQLLSEAVPEPSVACLLGVGAALALSRRRRVAS